MLVLSRKTGERILVGPNISVTVVRIGPHAVRIGIDAPRGLEIVREELEPKPVTGICVPGPITAAAMAYAAAHAAEVHHENQNVEFDLVAAAVP